ncbi:hypothetical protein [Nocardia sp. XZ_19_369]|uniref:hypothetical protein n=1 Tax=Nocardia sp. XZ_19_369 TaxID=2769487 RepID=UPI00188EE9B5|nr:hypothetical protein [Nocardia sp. XZ_19_369]
MTALVRESSACTVVAESGIDRPQLTVGIVAEDDQLQQTLVTLGALDGLDQIEIVIVARAAQDQVLLDAARSQTSSRWVLRWLTWRPGTAALNSIFAEARADWVLCLSPGTVLQDSALTDLAAFAAAHPQHRDLLQGPLNRSPEPDLTHLEPVWHRGRFGVASGDPHPSGEVSEIGMHDLGVFACHRDCWPGIHPRLGMSSGPPGYLHKKFRSRGGRSLSLPFLRWRNALDDGPESAWSAQQFFTYLLCWEDIGAAVEPILEHYTEGRGGLWVDQHLATWLAERNDPFDAFGAIVCINSDHQPQRWTRISARFVSLGIAEKVQRLPATLTPERYQLGCALSHRRAIEMARVQSLESILVFEDDAVFLNGTIWVLRHSVRELMRVPWKLFYLGGFYSDQENPLGIDNPAPNAAFLRHAPGLVTTHAIAYHRSVFDQILDELPADPESMRCFLADYDGHVDVYYSKVFNDGVYRCSPTVASQESYIHLEHPHLRDQFRVAP